MIEYVYGQDERLVGWASEILGQAHRFRPDAKAIGIEVDGALRGVVVFDTFSPIDCLVTVVSNSKRNWLTRAFIRRVMAYPFVQCGFPRITCLVSRSNKPSLRFTRRFGGWQLEGVLRKAGTDGEDMLLFGMLREDCVWLPLPEPAMAV